MTQTPRYVVAVNIPETRPSLMQYKVEDTKDGRNICYCSFRADANDIAKAMNVANSWEPILSKDEMNKLGDVFHDY